MYIKLRAVGLENVRNINQDFIMSGSKKAQRRFSLDSSGYHLDVCEIRSNMLRRSSEGKNLHSPDKEHLEFIQHNISTQKRSRSTTIEEESLDQPDGLLLCTSFKTHNKTFHKLFPDIPKTEDLEHVFTCGLKKEVIYHGKLYVSHHHVCFHSSVLLKETKVMILVSSIQTIKKKNTAKIVPNAIAIITDIQKYHFVSLRNREACFKLIFSLCPQLQTENINNNLKMSDTENQHDVTIDTISSLSSYEENADDHKLSPTEEFENLNNIKSLNNRVSWVTMVTEKMKSVLSTNDTHILNKLLVFYLILVVLLVLSSGYIGLRIVALEEQLGALLEFTLQREYNET
ncbi:GRAM domain-containing protein 2B [Misgurnus anguillicaudatus]|uniref:GRAM domain-containing protein 2B n=1 Tax=Misgurnus anguillicaudatus TaxID=75329 RepID=UPI003CCEFC0C